MNFTEGVKVFTQKVSNLLLNIEFNIWSDGFILNRTHESSTLTWLVYQETMELVGLRDGLLS